MYIINNKGYIFNTDLMHEIMADNTHILAVYGNSTRTISYNPAELKTIVDALKRGDSVVEVD